MKQGLTLQQKLQQKLSPLQIQTIKLIELPTIELEERIGKEVEENPLLDEVPEDSEENEDDTPSYRLYINNQSKDPKPEFGNTFRVRESFHQSLENQLGFCSLDDKRRRIASFIIGMIGDDGYLRRDSESLVDDIAFKTGIETDTDEVDDIIAIIQGFEPAGVGARDLRECLLLQLYERRQTEAVKLAVTILEDFFEPFSKKHYSRITARLGISDGQLKPAIDEIKRLNPLPGGQIDDSYADKAQQIVPDFVLEITNGVLQMTMPRYRIPELRINERYARELMDSARRSNRSGREAELFVRKKMESAKWFIEAIKQRHHTLESTMNAIIEFQREYFTDGDETKLRPMVLKNIAEKTGFDISTISRVVNSKYIQTHFGIFPLKYFFSEGMVNNDGEEVSTREIKNILSQSISEEDKRNPLTDNELVGILSEKGYRVARRTVAKYREQLSIPVARLRKEI